MRNIIYDSVGLNKLNRAWDWNFKVARVANIDIHVHWILMLYFATEFVKFLIHGEFLYGIGLLAGFWLITLGHELGHCFAARSRNQPAHKIILWPLGGLAMVGQSHKHADNIWIAFAGPAVNIAFALLILFVMYFVGEPIGWDMFSFDRYYGESFFADLFNWNWIVLLFNLLVPVEPLDGGRIFVGVLSMNFNKMLVLSISSVTSFFCGAIAVVWGAMHHSSFLAIVGAWVVWKSIQTVARLRKASARKKTDRLAKTTQTVFQDLTAKAIMNVDRNKLEEKADEILARETERLNQIVKQKKEKDAEKRQ